MPLNSAIAASDCFLLTGHLLQFHLRRRTCGILALQAPFGSSGQFRVLRVLGGALIWVLVKGFNLHYHNRDLQ